MTELPYTESNVKLVQDFIDETKRRIHSGVDITFNRKSNTEIQDLMLEFEITTNDIEESILNLSVENYYRGIDLSGRADYNVCAFRNLIGEVRTEIYLKYGLETKGLQILIFSNHIPKYPMEQPFKK